MAYSLKNFPPQTSRGEAEPRWAGYKGEGRGREEGELRLPSKDGSPKPHAEKPVAEAGGLGGGNRPGQVASSSRASVS